MYNDDSTICSGVTGFAGDLRSGVGAGFSAAFLSFAVSAGTAAVWADTIEADIRTARTAVNNELERKNTNGFPFELVCLSKCGL